LKASDKRFYNFSTVLWREFSWSFATT